MERITIKRFFECLIPVTVCNLKCSYCYIIQRNYRNMKLANLNYSPEHIKNCLTKERLGGSCFFSICGAGETLAQKETLDIVKGLLENGHLVNITTNGTSTNQFKRLENFTKDEISRLHFSFSFHYLELRRLNLINTFFSNIRYVHSLGASYMCQLNLCDDYLPYIDEIKQICKKEIGAFPQVAATRKESKGLNEVELMTMLDKGEYIKIGDSFDSGLFRYTIDNFNKKRSEFCYAGERSGTLDLSTGMLSKCYGDPRPQNIFENPEKPIRFEAIGCNCFSSFCFNSSHFMSLGVIDNGDNRTYSGIRDRKDSEWFNDTMRECLPYDERRKLQVNLKNTVFYGYCTFRHKCGKIVRKVLRKSK